MLFISGAEGWRGGNVFYPVRGQRREQREVLKIQVSFISKGQKYFSDLMAQFHLHDRLIYEGPNSTFILLTILTDVTKTPIQRDSQDVWARL